MGLWKKIFGKNARSEKGTVSSGHNVNVVADNETSASGHGVSIFVSLEMDGASYPLYGFELGCGLAGFGPYDKPDTLCDNAMILTVRNGRNESLLLEWIFDSGHVRNGRIVWHRSKDDCSSFLESVAFEDAVCEKYIKTYDYSLRCELIEIRLIPKIIRIGDSYIQRKCKL